MNVFVFYVLLTTRWDKVGKLKCKIFWFSSSWIVWWLQAERFFLQDVYFYTNKLQKIFSSCNRFLHVMIPCVAMSMAMAKSSELWVWHVGENMHFLWEFDCQIGMKSPMLSHDIACFLISFEWGVPLLLFWKKVPQKSKCRAKVICNFCQCWIRCTFNQKSHMATKNQWQLIMVWTLVVEREIMLVP